jgi:hypothetical protein
MSGLTNLSAAARRNGLRDQTAGSSTAAMIARPNNCGGPRHDADQHGVTAANSPDDRDRRLTGPCREQVTKSVDDSQRGNSECAGGSADGTTPNTATTVTARIQPGRSRSF